MDIHLVHPAAGDVIHLPPNPAAAVGDASDPARRPHVFRFAGACVRLIRFAGKYQVQPFLTVQQARAVMVNGAYHEHRRLNPALRAPDALIRPQAGLGDVPLERLSFLEAETLAQLAGGRLATEREIDFIVKNFPALRPSGTWCSWTGSSWSPFEYSLALWDESVRGWRAPEHEANDAGHTTVSCMRYDIGLTRYACNQVGGFHRSWVLFDL